MKKYLFLGNLKRGEKKSFSVLAVNHRSTAASRKQTGVAIPQRIMWMKVKLAVR